MNSHIHRRSWLLWAVPAALLLGSPVAHAQDAAPATDAIATTEEFSQGILFPYPLLEAALTDKMDKAGDVNYLELKGNKNLATFIRALATADTTQFPVHVSKDIDPKSGKEIKKEDHTAELTFWINAYNAFVLKTVSDAYPVKSPYDIKDFDTAQTHTVGGKPYSLKELRAKITKMDKRAYFALTDGTVGGPKLPIGGVYWYADLDARLNDVVSTFVRNSKNVEINTIQKTVTVSEHLKPADELFKSGINRDKLGGIRSILSAYSDGFNQKFFATQNYEIKFAPTENSLNDRTDKSATG